MESRTNCERKLRVKRKHYTLGRASNLASLIIENVIYDTSLYSRMTDTSLNSAIFAYRNLVSTCLNATKSNG